MDQDSQVHSQQKRIYELEAEVEAAKAETTHLRTRFQSAVEDAAMASASVQSLERTVRLLRKNQSQSPNDAAELQDLRAELDATRCVEDPVAPSHKTARCLLTEIEKKTVPCS